MMGMFLLLLIVFIEWRHRYLQSLYDTYVNTSIFSLLRIQVNAELVLNIRVVPVLQQSHGSILLF